MDTVAIPKWTSLGVLPPVNSVDQTSANRSPYLISLIDFVLHFGTTENRRRILKGFLEFRKQLHSLNMKEGFQWVDGSFLEDVEITEKRSPNDIDVVTFYNLPEGKSQKDLLPESPFCLSPEDQKNTYHVDSYFVHLKTKTEVLIMQGTYWYSMWSHRRNSVWKGYVQIDLAPSSDVEASEALSKYDEQERAS